MAREASDLRLAFEVFLVDSELHLDHLAGRLFGLLVVFLKCSLGVAEFTLDIQRIADELHSRNQLVCGDAFQHLDILVNLLSGFGCITGRLGRSRGGTGGDQDQAQNASNYHGGTRDAHIYSHCEFPRLRCERESVTSAS